MTRPHPHLVGADTAAGIATLHAVFDDEFAVAGVRSLETPIAGADV